MYITKRIDSLSVLMTDQHLEKQTLAVEITHILTQTDQGCNLLRKNITAIIKSLLLMLGFVIPSHVNQVDPTNPTASNDLIKLIFSTLCNLSFQDKISQKICHVGGPELMNQIFAFVKKNEANPAICKQALECVRNLCIDDLATKAILDTGTESLLDILKNGLPDLRLECLEIIRNIFLQNQACYINLQNQPGFIHEVQISLVDPSTELNLVALSIIKKWVESKGGRTAYCIALLRCGIIPTLSYVLSVVEASKRAEVLKCLNSFIKLKRELGESEDPWQLIKKSWDYKDILIGRTVKGKKSSKRKLRKKKL
ncbi:hypothetical protein HDV02_001172 [Globomyces sp. JEL0801]|nr:hypothetical protein HDV02_001172 [Globomyces sp. JEL0801]